MKKLLFLLFLLVALVAAAWFFLRDQEFVVTLSEAEMQERIEEMFPVDRQYLLVLTLQLSDPEVNLVEGDDRIRYGMRASLAVPAVGPLTGTGRVSGRLRYDAESRQLFLDDSRVEEIQIDGLPEMYRGPLRQVADLVASQQLDRHPVYTIEEGWLAELPGPVVLRDVRVGDGKVRVAFGLEDRPGLDLVRDWLKKVPGLDYLRELIGR